MDKNQDYKEIVERTYYSYKPNYLTEITGQNYDPSYHWFMEPDYSIMNYLENHYGYNMSQDYYEFLRYQRTSPRKAVLLSRQREDGVIIL